MSSDAHEEGEPTLLIVDDDKAFREALATAFTRRGFAVSVAENAADGERVARTRVFEYALVDVRMPGPSGIDLCATLRGIDEGTRIVVLTGYGTISNAIAAMKAGAIDYLTKPVEVDVCERALLGVRIGESTEKDKAIPSLDRVEWEYIQRVLADSGGNISDAARKLGMHRRSLQRKLARTAPRR